MIFKLTISTRKGTVNLKQLLGKVCMENAITGYFINHFSCCIVTQKVK